jgi:endonuclease III
MKTDIELAEDIMENLVLGNIESYITQYIDIAQKTNWNLVQQHQDKLNDLREEIWTYKQAKTPDEKATSATKIVDIMVRCRIAGLLKNNPNTIKAIVAERDFYRSRTEAAEQNAKDLQEELKSAYGAVQKLMENIEKMKLKGWTDKP